jgi:IPT/TIG domain
MKSNYIFSRLLFAFAFIFFVACKKGKVTGDGSLIIEPTVEKLSRAYVQSGEQITVYGKNLSQGSLLTEVTISGHPAEILVKASDSLVILVPPKVSTGKIMVTVSQEDQFKSGYGPAIEIKPTPLIKSFSPYYAYGGETVTLVVENFSINNADNSIVLNNESLPITGGNGHDTLLVKLPAAAHTGAFYWSTFRGPVQHMDTLFPVRQTSYPVTTVGQWVRQDPAFSFVDTLLRGYPDLAGSNYDLYQGIYNTILAYTNAPDRTYTIFLPSDEAYFRNDVSLATYLNKIKDKPYAYHGPLAAAIIPARQLSINTMQMGDLYNTLYTEQLVYYPLGNPDNILKMQVSEDNGSKYISFLGIWGETTPPVKVLREHKIGNATIIEIDGETGIVYF